MSLEVYVGNYPNSFTQNDILDLFRDFEGVRLKKFLKKDHKTFSFVDCVDQEQVVDVVTSLHDIDVSGRNLIVRASDKELQSLITESLAENKVLNKHPRNFNNPQSYLTKRKNYGINYKLGDEVAVSEFSEGVLLNKSGFHFLQTDKKNVYQHKLNQELPAESEQGHNNKHDQENDYWERPNSSATSSSYGDGLAHNAKCSVKNDSGINNQSVKDRGYGFQSAYDGIQSKSEGRHSGIQSPRNFNHGPKNCNDYKHSNLNTTDSGSQIGRDFNHGHQNVHDYKQPNFNRMQSGTRNQRDFNNSTKSEEVCNQLDIDGAYSRFQNLSLKDSNYGHVNKHDVTGSGLHSTESANDGCQNIQNYKQSSVNQMNFGAHSQSKNYNNDWQIRQDFKHSNINKESTGIPSYNAIDINNAYQNKKEHAHSNPKSLYQQDSGIHSCGLAMSNESENIDSRPQYDPEYGIRSPRSKNFNQKQQNVNGHSHSSSNTNIDYEEDPASFFDKNPGIYIQSPKDFKNHRSPESNKSKSPDITSPGSSNENYRHKSAKSPSKNKLSFADEQVSKEDLFYVSVANFPLYTDIVDLYELFEDLDPYDIVMICNKPRVDKKPTEAILSFKTQNQATDAIINFDNTSYYGRGLVVTDVTDICMVPALLGMGSKDVP